MARCAGRPTATLERWARRPTSAQAPALRAKIVLACNRQVPAQRRRAVGLGVVGHSGNRGVSGR
ncbi:hypothetical protein F5972_04450 [Microbispora cellulosiformans]|uniref:Transposase n=1 Tax=Microbispora cellulosiformans TaxID=2614688 RepID=A0A5J5K7Q8_9ACTN|nr:hypothetical protein F5972_04450 [Microbispora cellulosiformans]